MECPETAPIAVSALAAAIAEGRSNCEVALLAAMLVQLGDSLAAILAFRECGACPPNAPGGVS